jgi:hypothetical protein
MQRSLLLFIFLLLLQSVGFAQTKFYVTISAKEIGKEDYLQLKLIVENANTVDKVSNPMLTNFSIESGPNEETGFSKINGKTKKYLALNYIIKPKAAGTFTIPAVIAIADGKEYKSESITIKVLDKATVNRQPQTSVFDAFDDQQANQINIAEHTIKDNENIADKVKGKMFVKAEVDKRQVFVGEPIGVTYKLYTRLKSESNVIKNPSFNGFSVVDMELNNPMQYGIEKLNGKEFNVYVLRKAQLYPLQDGQLTIDKVEVENVVTFIKESYLKKRQDNFFDDLGQTPLPPEALINQKINIESEVININVKPLPSKNVPLQFKGAVGNFTISSKLASDIALTNTTNKLIVTIVGEGNLHLINAPEITWAKNFESFEPIVTDEIDKTTLPLSGSKTFTFPFVVSDIGKYMLDSIHFVYFDTKLGIYKKVSSQPKKINVDKGLAINVIIDDEKNNSKNLLAKLTSNRKWVITLLALLVALGIFVWIKNEKKKQIQTTEVKLDDAPNELPIITKDWLHNSKQVLTAQDDAKFYKTINTEFINFLGNRFDIDVANVNKQNILQAMAENKIGQRIIVEVATSLQFLEDKLYNPFSNAEKNITTDELLASIENIIQHLS